MGGVSIKLEGIGSVEQVLKDLERDIGDKKAQSKVLIPAVREAMKSVLAMAKAKAPKDTHDLANSLQIEARRPTKKDIRSKYITENDTVIAIVTTKSFPLKAKRQFFKQNADLYESDKKEFNKKMKATKKAIGVLSDARAVAQEFGTANMNPPPHPFMRVSLESTAQSTVDNLGKILARRIAQYRMKNTIKT